MSIRDECLLHEPPVDRDEGRPTAAEVAEAESLISDLAVLLDAGLIEVRAHVLGPARYAVALVRHR